MSVTSSPPHPVIKLKLFQSSQNNSAKSSRNHDDGIQTSNFIHLSQSPPSFTSSSSQQFRQTASPDREPIIDVETTDTLSNADNLTVTETSSSFAHATSPKRKLETAFASATQRRLSSRQRKKFKTSTTVAEVREDARKAQRDALNIVLERMISMFMK
jgi:hypothetical protein